jgi:uncharacterized protein HemY
VDGTSFAVNWFWIIVSVLNFVVFVAIVCAVVLFLRWLIVGRRRELEEIAQLRARVEQLESGQGDLPPTS